ncbi:MAG: ABC transporter ATP-binding protein, partial [Acutalibacter sp.]
MLEGKELTFSYSRKGPQVLSKVNLTVSPGERVGLRAPSGRGKTTLCRVLAGYQKPRSGEVLVDGKPLSSYSGPCPVQMVWQHPETVVDPLLPLGVTLSEASPPEQRLLQALHIREGWLTRYPTELSGGELQRFCLARALHPATRYLLCDGISAMLDLVTQAQIWEFLLQEAKTRNLGFLVVSHSDSLLERV